MGIGWIFFSNTLQYISQFDRDRNFCPFFLEFFAYYSYLGYFVSINIS